MFLAGEEARGQVVDDVKCAANPSQSYALYLPSTYTPARRWSLLVGFHPGARGRAIVEKYRAAAERFGYIVAGSNNSRNGPWETSMAAIQAMSVDLGLIDTYTGLIVPLIASATATLLFRQFFLTIPGELVEAARVDGAGPWRFFKDILLPLSRTNIAALFVILFIYGWTQYIWPLLVTNRNDMNTIVIALKKMISFADADTEWHLVMVTSMLAIVPPILVVVLMQRWFVRGLVETEK